MYVQSDAKRKKESSMAQKLTERFEAELQSIDGALSKKGGTKKLEKVWERIGRAKEKRPRASGQYKVEVDHNNKGVATRLRWKRKESPVRREKEKGVYFIRTSYKDPNEKEMWDSYNTIREVESTFRCLKSDLKIRPVHHQKDERVESHIYLTLLAYQVVNTIRHMLKPTALTMTGPTSNASWPPTPCRPLSSPPTPKPSTCENYQIPQKRCSKSTTPQDAQIYKKQAENM